MTTLELTKGQLKYVDHVSHLLMKDCYLSDGVNFEGNVYSSLDWPVDSVTDVLMDEIRRKERCPANREHWLFWDAVEARTIELLKEQEGN